MGLGLPVSSGGGDRTPIIKYDGRAGRINRVDRSNESGTWETKELEITKGFAAVFDLENIETGWMNFSAAGPDFKMVKVGEAMPERPSPAHRPGFRVLMKLGKTSGDDLREMASNAKVAIAGMDALYDTYAAERQNHPGKLPVVGLSDTIQVKTQGKDADGKPQSSTNYQPVWEILKWVPRPAELGGEEGSTPDPEPKPEPVKQPAMADDEF